MGSGRNNLTRRHKEGSGCRLNWKNSRASLLIAAIGCIKTWDPDRSEEHTSELQSLMRISYAVFCLQKKKKHTKQTKYHSIQSINKYRDIDTTSRIITHDTYQQF